MLLHVCIDQTLEPVMKPCLLEKQYFVLGTDLDNGYGKAKNCNIVRWWKKGNSLEHLFSCASSSDLSPIENFW